jgi:signal transduction histidine kinase
VISGDSIETVLGAVSEKIASIPGVTFCRIYLLGENNKRLLPAAEAVSGEGKSHKPDNIAIDIEELPIHKVALISGQPQILRSDEFEKLSSKKHNLNIPEMQNGIIQIIPMHTGDMATGCLTIGMVGPDDDPAAKKGLFENLAHHLSSILKNLLKYFEIRKSLERLQDSHDRELKQARLEAIDNLANGICTNLDSMMKSFMCDMEKYHILKDNEIFSEIADTISSHLNEYRRMITNISELSRRNSAEKLHQLELALFIKKAETRLLEESGSWPAKTDNIRIITHNSGSGQILGDENELYNAVSRIVLNAIESMPYGGDVLIESKVEGRMAILEIRDQGSGMSEGEVKRIFEPFFTTKEGTARGLGLPIAHRIIALHDGEIDVQSEPGRGSRFIIKIPLIDPEQTALYNLKKKSADGRPLSS